MTESQIHKKETTAIEESFMQNRMKSRKYFSSRI